MEIMDNVSFTPNKIIGLTTLIAILVIIGTVAVVGVEEFGDMAKTFFSRTFIPAMMIVIGILIIGYGGSENSLKIAILGLIIAFAGVGVSIWVG